MRIARVHIGAELVVGDEILLDKPQSHYLKKVLRLRSGAAFFLFNGREAVDYRATLVIDGTQARARIEAALPLDTESGLETEIIQGLGRADHMDWMVQKTTELGIGRITLFNAERSQPRLRESRRLKKLDHWRGVATSACEQCGRAIVPAIAFHDDIERALAETRDAFRILLDFDGPPLASALPAGTSAISILLGPEGGLTEREIRLARSSLFQPVRLGPRVLRTETAASAALAIVQSELGDMA